VSDRGRFWVVALAALAAFWIALAQLVRRLL